MIHLKREGISTIWRPAPLSIAPHLHQRRRQVVLGISCQVSSHYPVEVEEVEEGEKEDIKQRSMFVLCRTAWQA